MRRRARVYYSLLGASLLAALVLVAGGRADGQVSLTITSAMSKGPAGAAVTIVEFSDYQ
jgi:hypothetical protein